MTGAVESSPQPPASPDAALQRAAAAVDALAERHLRRLGHVVPGTRIGVSSWPPVGRFGSAARLKASWNYWWQAHLVDVLVDAAVLGDPRAAREATALVRGIRIRNIGRWTNEYYDDMAWLALALERADRHLPRSRHRGGLRTFTRVLSDAWTPDLGGGIPWRTTDHFFNVPANGPAGIFLARRGHVERAVQTADWIDRTLLLPSGLIADGFWVESDGGRRDVDTVYAYCQGVTLGLLLECYRLTRAPRHLERLTRLLGAVEERCAVDGVLTGHGGGDGGLFSGILARYLALIATDLPRGTPGADGLRARAGALVRTSADSAWAHRAQHDGLPVFGPDWSTQATVPGADGAGAAFVGGAVRSSSTPERDLSVQIAGAMLMTAAASVTLRSPEHTGSVTPE
ncbi:glycoside hydrolase family 76 protein [Gordonia caeni]|uniref:Glycosyl hydrolase n=1 Tax=Gordonia caeni TaxID=1007097 RepID=A0ABP7NRJ1_9ACTN